MDFFGEEPKKKIDDMRKITFFGDIIVLHVYLFIVYRLSNDDNNYMKHKIAYIQPLLPLI